MADKSFIKNVKLEDLFNAYRKAKADTFFEKSQPKALDFAAYESDLPNHLKKLFDRLSAPRPSW